VTADAPEPPRLDDDALARRQAALAHVRTYGDPVLRERARRVEAFDDGLREEIDTMAALMDDAYGAGLAATQLGILHRVLVYRRPGEPDAPVHALVNPEIAWASDEREVFPEGCLSLPGVWVDVERPARVRVVARDRDGAEVVVEASGPEASVLQHEIDHLDGVLILDRIEKGARKEAMRTLRDGQRTSVAP
jgi:peptide deformylase